MKFALFFVLLESALAAGGGYGPLITDSTLRHYLGDKQRWSFRNGLLTGEQETPGRESFLLSNERFGDFHLKFSARCAGAGCRILVRGTIQPPFQLAGYQVEIGSAAGSLSYCKPGRFESASMKAEPQKEVSLVRASSAPPADGWNDYEITAVGDQITVQVNNREAARITEDRGFRDGAIGFRLASGGSGKLEFKDLQIRLLGNVVRKDSTAWIRDTEELLELAKSSEGFQPLFDGATLNGWQDTTRFWSPRDGAISGQPHNSFLVTAKDYANFVLKASVRLHPKNGNSGIQVRSEVIPEGMRGYQIDIGDPWWGHLYAESTQRGILIPVADRKKRMQLVRADDWNDFVIVYRNEHILAQLNNEVTADLIDYYGEKTGKIGLQIHVGPPMKVEYRNIQIKVLP